MKKALLGLIILITCFVGCAGTRFTRIPDKEIGLGHDSPQTIRTRLGKPFGEATVIKNGKTIRALSYSFAKASFKFTGPVPSRAQVFYFYNDILIGHIYTSTGQNDQTQFDSSKVEKIKENQTKIDEAMALLGTPSGHYVYPMVEKENEKAEVYFYVQVKPGFMTPKLFQQILIVSYDPKGIVRKLDFVEGGER